MHIRRFINLTVWLHVRARRSELQPYECLIHLPQVSTCPQAFLCLLRLPWCGKTKMKGSFVVHSFECLQVHMRKWILRKNSYIWPFWCLITLTALKSLQFPTWTSMTATQSTSAVSFLHLWPCGQFSWFFFWFSCCWTASPRAPHLIVSLLTHCCAITCHYPLCTGNPLSSAHEQNCLQFCHCCNLKIIVFSTDSNYCTLVNTGSVKWKFNFHIYCRHIW